MTRKLLVVIFISFFFLQICGCAGQQVDGDRTRAEGTAVGAAGGALIGALIGQLIGGDTGATLLGAGIGAVAGGIGGYAYGDHVTGQKEKYAKEEDWLDACIAEARKANEKIDAFNMALQGEIEVLKRETEEIMAQYTDAGQRQEKLVALRKDAHSQLESAEETLAAARKELEAQTPVAAQARQNGQLDYADDLDSELEKLKTLVAELEARTDELAALSASMAV